MFDKNSIIGLSLITVLMAGYFYVSQPSKEEQAAKRAQFVKDSVALVAKQQIKATEKAVVASIQVNDSLAKPDSLIAKELDSKYKVFAGAVEGKSELNTLENNLLKVTFDTKGGKITSVILKEHKRFGGAPLELFNKDSLTQGLSFLAYNNQLQLNTNDLYFTGTKTGNSIEFKSNTGAEQYISFKYTLNPNGYDVACKIDLHNMGGVISSQEALGFQWKMNMPKQEQYIVKEREASNVNYKLAGEEDGIESISPAKDEENKSIAEAPTKWVSFHQQFFSAIVVADKEFDKTGSSLTQLNHIEDTSNVKRVGLEVGIPYHQEPNASFGMKFYFMPNHYKTMKALDLGFEKQISVGWSIFKYINTVLVIPVLDMFKGKNISYGWVILLLTLVIKILLLPIAIATYKTSAKMRLLKPEVDKATAKFGDDPMKKQQASMEIYRKAGVNQLAGCLPMVFQMFILFALFAVFPSAIQLRQEALWWTSDLSTYDSIYTFGHLPVIDFIYGDHVSLFAILMTISTLIFTWYNAKISPQAQTMPGMQFMMYFMPIMFLAFLNKYAAGLSYYYLLANVFNIAQALLLKYIIHDDKLLTIMETNRKKPVKKSGFQAKLEEMTKERQKQLNTKK